MSTTNNVVNGVIRGHGQHDWIAGANSPIVRKTMLPGKDWSLNAIHHENQFIQEFLLNTPFCVSFQETDAFEYLVMQQLRLGLVPQWKVKWLQDNGYFVNGEINTNEIYTAILGGTTKYGAYLYAVADGIRQYGLVPQDRIQYKATIEETLDRKQITEETLALGKKFAELFLFNFEWVLPTETETYLQYSPLPCVGFFANENTPGEILNPQSGSSHCMAEVAETEEYRKTDDSYYQQFKKYDPSALSDFMAFYIDASDNNMFNAGQFIKDHDTFQVRNTNTGAYGVIYHGVPLLITKERAGLYLIDRDARGLLGKGKELTVSLTQQEWDQLDWSHQF